MSSYYGTPKLGYKVASAQEPGLLGDEHDNVPIEVHESGVLINHNNGRVRVKWLQNTSAVALVPGSIVKRDILNDMAHDVVVAAADEPGCAIVDPYLDSSVEAGERFLGIIKGEVPVLSGAAATKGDSLKSDANGKAITNALAAVADITACCGVLMEDATAADELVRAVVDFPTYK